MATRRSKVTAIALGLGALSVSAGVWNLSLNSRPVHAQQEQDATLKELLTNRHDVLKKIAAVYAEIQKANIGNFQLVYEAERDVLFAELELCETENERTAVLKRIVVSAKEHERLALRGVEDGILTPNAGLKATVERLDAEIALKRARGGK